MCISHYLFHEEKFQCAVQIINELLITTKKISFFGVLKSNDKYYCLSICELWNQYDSSNNELLQTIFWKMYLFVNNKMGT